MDNIIFDEGEILGDDFKILHNILAKSGKHPSGGINNESLH